MGNIKLSSGTTVTTVESDRFIPLVSFDENEKITRDNLFNQIKNAVVPTFIYRTIDLLQAANLEADPDEPTYVRCEETEYRLYKITSLAPGVDDISLNNGTTATYQVEYRDNGFVIGPASSTAGALAVFSDTSGEILAEGATPTNVGNALIEITSVSQKSYPRINVDDTTTAITVAQLKTDLNLPSDTNAEITTIESDITAIESDITSIESDITGINAELLARVQTVATIADLTALTGMVDGQQFNVTSHSSGWAATVRGPFGGGEFVWDATSVVAENLVTVFESDAGGAGRFVRLNKQNKKASWAGIVGDDSDETDKIALLSDSIESGDTVDFENMIVRIANQGTNFDITENGGRSNQTTYLSLIEKNNVTFQNGGLVCTLNLTTESMTAMSFWGCKDIFLKNFSIDHTCSGGYTSHESRSTLVSFRPYESTEGDGLYVDEGCRFRNYHPQGASHGPNREMKLIGFYLFTDFDSGTPANSIRVRNIKIKDSLFEECTARVIWHWAAYNVETSGCRFYRCGVDANAFAHSIIRILLDCKDINVHDCVVEDCYGTLMICSNNSTGSTPINVKYTRNEIRNCTGQLAIAGADTVLLADLQIADSGASSSLINIFDSYNARIRLRRLNVVGATGIDTVRVNSTASGSNTPIDIRDLVVSGGNRAVYHETGDVKIRGLLSKSTAAAAVFSESTSGDLNIADSEIESSGSDGLGCSATRTGTTDIKRVKITNPAQRGIRLAPGGLVHDVKIYNPVADGISLLGAARVTDSYIEDGAATLTTSSGINNANSTVGGVALGNTVYSPSAKFQYGIKISTNNSKIGRSTFIGTVGTTANVLGGTGSSLVDNQVV